MKKVFKFYLVFILVFQMIMFSGCGDNNSNDSNTNTPPTPPNEETTLLEETIALTEDNIDEYLYYTYIYNSDNLSQKRYESSGYITYNAYTIEINFYPKNNSVKFKNCVITLGRFVKLTGVGGVVYCNDNYTYTVYLDENGNGQYKNQVWVRGAWEKEAFTKKYYNIQGEIVIS